MKLNPTTEKFILHWGEMGTKWGVNRTVAQIHALLYILGRPMNAEEITETLGVARSNVSNSIKELQNLRLVHTVHILGDRRDHFETSDDVWTLFRTIAEVRMQREIEPTRQFLQSLIDSPEFSQENETAKQRIQLLFLFPFLFLFPTFTSGTDLFFNINLMGIFNITDLEIGRASCRERV